MIAWFNIQYRLTQIYRTSKWRDEKTSPLRKNDVSAVFGIWEKFYSQFLTLWARSLRKNPVIAEAQHLVTVVTRSIDIVGGWRVRLFVPPVRRRNGAAPHYWCSRHLLHRPISHKLCNAEVLVVTASWCFLRFLQSSTRTKWPNSRSGADSQESTALDEFKSLRRD